jgi:4-amino-4-deoxy-L-arabinose transferase-like glycosyltransferase
MGLGLATAAVAQALLDGRGPAPLALGLLVAGAALFAWATRHVTLERAPAEKNAAAPRGIRWPWLGPAGVFGAWALVRFEGNRFHADALLLWASGLILLLWASAGWSRRWLAAPKRLWRGEMRLSRDALLLAAILAVGAFFRLYRIGEIPLEMGCDLPLNQFNIGDILQGERPIFFPRYPGREGLFFYLAAPLCAVFGLSHTSIKVASALIGLSSVPLLYLLGRELYNRRVGLWAAFLLSISHWHIILSRTGFRSCTLPPVLIAMLLLISRGLRTRSIACFAWAGLFLGIAFYTYNAAMVLPLLVAAIALLSGLGMWRQRQAPIGHWILLVAVALYALIPLGRYVFDEPQRYLYRVATRMTALEAPLSSELGRVLAGNAWRAFTMFNVRGDAVFINNVPFYRQMGFVSAICLALGAAYGLWRGRRGPGMLLLGALGVMLLPSILSLAFPHEVPNAGRAIGALPPAMLLAALPPALIQERLTAWLCDGESRGRRRAATLALLALMAGFAAEAAAVYPLYFCDYVRHLPGGNYSISLEMARAIDAFAGSGEAYIRAWPHWYDGNAVRAQLRLTDPSWRNELSGFRPDQPPLAGPPGRFMVILHPEDAEGLAQLQQAFPCGLLLEHWDHSQQVAFYTFYGER